MKYAFGEILLVVIGILIALQINNWNENRKNRVEEKALLTQLESEFKINLEQLNEKIEMRNLMITSSLKLLEYIDNPDGIANDSIIKYILPTTLSPTFNPIVNDINSSGRIQLLTNPRLKELLSLWTSEIVQVTEVEVQWYNYSSDYYVPFLVEHGSFLNIMSSYWSNKTMNVFQLDKRTNVQFNLKKSKTLFNESTILNNKNFEDHLGFCVTLAKITNIQSETLKNRITELLKLIGTELEK